MDLDFEAIYRIYPRKEGKAYGMRNLAIRVKDQETYDRVMKAAKNYTELCRLRGTEKQFIKLFGTFVNNWTDYEDISEMIPDKMNEPNKTNNNRLLMEMIENE